MPRFSMIAFDADDTLWHNERLYAAAQARFKHLLAHYHDPQWIEERLYEAEMRNLPHFGYGIKSFALSMIETAVELTEGRVSGQDILTLVETAKAMLAADVELLDHVATTVRALAATHTLMIITKGDLLDQESKVARSGLAASFDHIEIVSQKTPESYAAVLRRVGVTPDAFLMVGNSLRSDILPVLALGAQAVYVPYALTWAHEVVEPPPADQPGFHEIAHLGLLPGLVQALESA
ncbi:MAG: HAD family hydrolase [Anaerolineae bacterium]